MTERQRLDRIKALIVECLDSHPDTPDQAAHNRLLVHYMQQIESVVDGEPERAKEE